MKIELKITRRLPVKLGNVIEKLLSVIPEEHLASVSKILITEYTPGRDKDAAGVYRYNEQRKYSEIELNLSNIFWEKAYGIYFFPLIYKYMIAHTLYHEIGHNCQKFVHSLKKNKWEDFADRYPV